MNRYKIVGSAIKIIPKRSLIHETHLETMAEQLNLRHRKIGKSLFVVDAADNVLVKGDLVENVSLINK